MHTENFVIDESRHREHIEAAHEPLPHADVEPSLALVIEPVYLRDILAFVITSKQEHGLWVFHLVSEEKADGLYGTLAAVHIVSQEKVVGERRVASKVQEAEKVLVLPVDV